MKKLLPIAFAAFALAACGESTVQTTDDTDTGYVAVADTGIDKGEVAQSMCFQKLSGNSKQDTATLHLNIIGENVTGDFENRPFQKDARKGAIAATYRNDLIKGIWVYMQEGVADTLPVEFKLTDNKLIQKNYTVDPKTGREVFSDASVFNIEFQKVDCEN